MTVEIVTLHISVDHMDGHTWLLFTLILAPALILFVWTAVKVQRDTQYLPGAARPESPSEDWRAWDESL
jgi:hypothetical protein